jgi:hypothetical protein
MAPLVFLDVYLTTKLADGVFLISVADKVHDCTVPMNQPVALFVSQPCRIVLPMISVLLHLGGERGAVFDDLVARWCDHVADDGGDTAGRIVLLF